MSDTIEGMEHFAAMKAKAERCDWAEAALDEVRFAWGTEVADRDRKIAELSARVAELEEKLLWACSQAVGAHGENERDVCRVLGVQREDLADILSDAKNVNWICRKEATNAD